MIYIASDHAGYELKKHLCAYFDQHHITYEDCGPFNYDALDDYPDFIIPAAEKVARGTGEDKGIVIGGSGQGEAIAANKVEGVRAALFYGGNKDIITLSRQHNKANVFSLGARFVRPDEAVDAVELWLKTKEGEEVKHLRRIEKIHIYEQKK